MSFFPILAMVLCGWAILVGADYYIEFRAPTAEASSSRGSPETTRFLFECRGDPVGTPAIMAAQSICTLVTSNEQKSNIYRQCNFYSVYRPNLQGHVIHLVGHGTMTLESWYLGFFNHDVDHPNFADPRQEDVNHFWAELDANGCNFRAGSLLRNRLIIYYAQNNILSYSRGLDYTNSMFNAFVTSLKGLTFQYFSIDQESETKQLKFAEALKMALQKMIDPCSIVQSSASDSCNTYCNFLNLAALYFYVIWDAGHTPLQGGYCVGPVCTCTKIATNNPLAGCSTSPMQECNNSLRLKLDL